MFDLPRTPGSVGLWYIQKSCYQCSTIHYDFRILTIKILVMPVTAQSKLEGNKLKTHIYYKVPTPYPKWNSLPFPYFFLTLWLIFPTNFAWNCVKYFYLQRIFQNIGYKRLQFSNNFGSVCGQISYLLF